MQHFCYRISFIFQSMLGLHDILQAHFTLLCCIKCLNKIVIGSLDRILEKLKKYLWLNFISLDLNKVIELKIIHCDAIVISLLMMIIVALSKQYVSVISEIVAWEFVSKQLLLKPLITYTTNNYKVLLEMH